MIVQCHACGAPLDVAGKSGSVVCAYCRSKQRVRALTVQAPQTPLGWHPPPTWASPAGQYAYHPVAAPSGGHGAVIALVGVLAVSGASAGVFAITAQVKSTTSRTTSPQVPAVQVESTPNVEAPATTSGTAATVSLFADPRSVLATLAAKFGADAQLLELTLFPDYAIVQLAVAGRGDAVDRYTYRARGLDGPTPVSLSSTVTKRLGRCLFSLGSVDPGAVPRIAADAKSTLSVEAGELTHLMLGTCPFHETPPTWVAHMAGPRGGDSATYDLSGRRLDGRGAAAPGRATSAPPTAGRPGATPSPTPQATQPPSKAKPTGACGCATDDLVCIMRCSKQK